MDITTPSTLLSHASKSSNLSVALDALNIEAERID
jgi:hypothetical protein